MEKMKKSYSAPKVTKVKLVIKEAILGGCFGSTLLAPNDAMGCTYVSGEPCYAAPGTL